MIQPYDPGCPPVAALAGRRHSFTRSGNRCGHNPARPCLAPVKPPSRNLPPVILQVCDQFQKYYDTPQMLPLLNAANGSLRRQRSERREAVVVTFLQLMKYYNLLTGRSEIPTQSGPLALTVAWIAEQAGLGVKRTLRAMKDLQLAGLIQIKPRSKLTCQGYRGVAAIKMVTDRIFRSFGLLDELKRQVRHKENELALKTQRIIEEANPSAAEHGRLLEALRRKVSPQAAQRHAAGLRQGLLEEHKRQIQLNSLALRQQQPDLPLAEVRRQAAMQLMHEALK